MTRVASGKTSAHPREPASPHAWLDALRRAGADRFASVGFPKTTDEEWRLTNVAPIAKTKFAAPSPTPSDEALELVRQGTFGADAQLELVFVNGRHVPALSHANRRSLGVSVGTIQQFLAENSAFLQENLGNIADITLTPFVAQNTAPSWMEAVFTSENAATSRARSTCFSFPRPAPNPRNPSRASSSSPTRAAR